MRSIVGVQEVAGGDVTVMGLPAGSPELRRRVGYVTQAPSVYADLTVRENLRHFARVLDASPEDVDRAIGTVGLGGYADRVVGRMSGGQRNRASLAIAVLAQPALLVLDEPTVGLDPLLRRDLWDTFRGSRASGVTLLVSSHVMDEAAECDLLLLMREGRLVAQETPDELRARTGTDDLGEAFLRLIERRGWRRERPGDARRRRAGAGPAAARPAHDRAAAGGALRADGHPALRVRRPGETFQRIGPPLLGLLPFITMFLVTSISMLRERTSGTLERLMSMPVAKLDLLAGYGIAFGLVALLQTVILGRVARPARARRDRSLLLVVLAILNALLGMALGLFISAFATTEFQAVQFMPAVVLPQLLLCGLFVPRDQMAGWLEAISYALPLTYAYDALACATSSAELGAAFARDVTIVVGVTLGRCAGRADAAPPHTVSRRCARGYGRTMKPERAAEEAAAVRATPAPPGPGTEAVAAATVARVARHGGAATPAGVRALHRTAGNAAVGRLLGRQPAVSPPARGDLVDPFGLTEEDWAQIERDAAKARIELRLFALPADAPCPARRSRPALRRAGAAGRTRTSTRPTRSCTSAGALPSPLRASGSTAGSSAGARVPEPTTKEAPCRSPGTRSTPTPGPGDWFTGAVYIDTVATPAEPSRVGAAQRPLHARRPDRVAHAPASARTSTSPRASAAASAAAGRSRSSAPATASSSSPARTTGTAPPPTAS